MQSLPEILPEFSGFNKRKAVNKINCITQIWIYHGFMMHIRTIRKGLFMGTLGSLLLYLGVIVLGIVLGSQKKVRKCKLGWLSKFQTIILVLLIFALGVEIGADERVISSLGTIGVSALVITLMALAGSVAAVWLVRRMMGLDKKGRERKKQ